MSYFRHELQLDQTICGLPYIECLIYKKKDIYTNNSQVVVSSIDLFKYAKK